MLKIKCMELLKQKIINLKSMAIQPNEQRSWGVI